MATDTVRIRMGGYGPATTAFSRSLKFIGDRLAARFGDAVDVKYVWNIMDLGYRADDILWLVEDGLPTVGYQSSSYLTDRVPAVGARGPYLPVPRQRRGPRGSLTTPRRGISGAGARNTRELL